MNKIYILLFVLLMNLSFFCGFSYSQQEDSPMNVSVSINSTFKLSIEPQFIDFGTLDPGETSEVQEIVLTCTTNNNMPWGLSISASAPLTSGNYFIPNESFNFDIVSAGEGMVAMDSGQVDTVPFQFYTAGLDEYITESPVNIALYFSLNVPYGQPAGTYETSVTITMIEQ
jgi:hypothetical protein